MVYYQWNLIKMVYLRRRRSRWQVIMYGGLFRDFRGQHYTPTALPPSRNLVLIA